MHDPPRWIEDDELEPALRDALAEVARIEALGDLLATLPLQSLELPIACEDELPRAPR